MPYYGANDCQCGCGGTTQREFCPGHDARHRGNLLRTARLSDAFRLYGGRPFHEPSASAYDELNRRDWLPTQHGTNRRSTGNRATRRTPEVQQAWTPSTETEAVAVVFRGWSSYANIRRENRTFGVEFETVPASGRSRTEQRALIIQEFVSRGLECHAEGYNHSTRPYWKLVGDLSVSSQPGQLLRDGIEIVSPILCGEIGFVELKLACEAMEAAGCQVNRTCGTHVHMGTAGMDQREILLAARIYGINQSYFDQMVSPSRRGNPYCQPLNQTDLNRLQVSTTISNGSPLDRYRTVNLHAFNVHNTLEFRQHQGTVEYRKISTWIRLMQSVMDLAESIPSAELAVAPAFTSLSEMFQVLGITESDAGYISGRIQALAGNAARATATV